jgi:thiosulfate/3-mercaptopyruvate sulfurtransferase
MDEEGRAAPATFTPRVRPELVADAEEVAALPDSVVLVDSRAAARYAGEVEPLDPKAGHIPGARNVDWSGALDANGYFLPPERQRERLAVTEGRDAVLYCGSGVSAAVNLLALELAGRPLGAGSRLYAGSWSDWVSGEGTRRVATGREDGTPGTEP